MSLKLSISGARGIVGESLTPDVVISILRHFVEHIPDGAVVIGRDTRPSGEPLERLCEGFLRLVGRDVKLLGVVPTPTVAFCTKRLGAAGGIAITASHNPQRWNALKLIGPDGLFLPPDFWSRVDLGNPPKVAWAPHNEVGSAEDAGAAVADHIGRILSLPWVDADAVLEAGLKVAYDGVGGAGPRVMIPLLAKLGTTVSAIGDSLKGYFIHDPEPVAENLGMLCELVGDFGADVGLATDPDADRLALVDERGVAVGEEFTLALAAEHVLASGAKSIVVNLSTSTLVDWVAKRHGAKVYRVPVGEYWVSRKMLELGSPVGGEGNGGVIVPAMHPVRDAATAAALVLSLLALRKKPLSQIVAQFPKRVMLKDKVPFEGDFAPVAERIAGELSLEGVDRTDGVWAPLEDGFVHIRPSNTEPVVRIIVESSNEDKAKTLLEKAKSKLLG